jgi:hypothetical protein
MSYFIRRLVSIACATVAFATVLPPTAELRAQSAIGDTHAQPPGGDPRALSPLGEVKALAAPLSLEELVEDSEKIVRGKVEAQSIATQLFTDGRQEFPTEVYRIKLRVEDVLKGSVRQGDAIDILQWASIAQPVKEGDELLLYLPPESRFGLASPVGIYSGQFKIVPSKGVKQAVNLNNNVGLWSDKKSLYASSPRVKSTIERDLSDKNFEIRAQVMEEASQPNKPGPLSVDLLTSATKALTGM